MPELDPIAQIKDHKIIPQMSITKTKNIME